MPPSQRVQRLEEFVTGHVRQQTNADLDAQTTRFATGSGTSLPYARVRADHVGALVTASTAWRTVSKMWCFA